MHLGDNAADRRLGEQWERHFCDLAAGHGKAFSPHQIGHKGSACWYRGAWNPALLPDVTVWTAPGEHHEIKHKNPTRMTRYGSRCFGLEKYRLDALVAFRTETRQPVLYTIHNWELAGVRESTAPMANRLQDWLTVDVFTLDAFIVEHEIAPETLGTWVNADPTTRPGYYWPITLWQPLERWWSVPVFGPLTVSDVPFEDDAPNDLPF